MKKIFEKFLFINILLLLGFTSIVNVFAEEVEVPDVIKEANAKIDKPVAGEKLDMNPKSGDSNKYDVSVTWMIGNQAVSSDTVAEKDVKYTAQITFVPKVGYEFDIDTVFTINDETTNAPSSEAFKTRLIEYTAEEVQLEVIKEAIATIKKPIIGKNLDTKPVSGDDKKYTVELVSWSLSTEDGEDEIDGYSTYTVVKDSTYLLVLRFTPLKGYKFSTDTVFKINGEATDALSDTEYFVRQKKMASIEKEEGPIDEGKKEELKKNDDTPDTGVETTILYVSVTALLLVGGYLVIKKNKEVYK